MKCIFSQRMATSAAVLFFSAFCIYILSDQNTVLAGPIHASCKLTWKFTAQCNDIHNKLSNQINIWTSEDNCKSGGEKCLYKLIKETDNEIQATHETPKKHYVDDITFDFQQSGDQCVVQGKSTSETWYAVLDYGTNYCNMHNLLTGASLDTVTGYKEETSNSICTQFSSADCKVY